MAGSGPLPLAITCGDPAGIGPEVIDAWALAHPEEAKRVVVIGPAQWLRADSKTLSHARPEVSGKGAGGSGAARFGAVIPVGVDDYAAVPGQPDAESSLRKSASTVRAASSSLRMRSTW